MALRLIGKARFVLGEGTEESPYRRVVVDNDSNLAKLPKHIADDLRAAGVLLGEEDKPKPKPKAE
jgi:hypothetical protein